MVGIKRAVGLGQVLRETGINWKGTLESFLDLGVGYMNIDICQNSSKCTFNICAFEV